MRFALAWLVSAVAIIIASFLLPGVTVDGLIPALILAVVLGGINIFIKPLLILLTLPLTIVTFGLFLVVLNTVLFQLAASIVPGFAISSFWSALWFSIVLTLVNSVLFRTGSHPAASPPSAASSR